MVCAKPLGHGGRTFWVALLLAGFALPAAQVDAGSPNRCSTTSYDHVMLDISWDEVARCVVRDADTVAAWTAPIEKCPTRFLFGTDFVSPSIREAYASTHEVYRPLWDRLHADVRARVERRNHECVFDAPFRTFLPGSSGSYRHGPWRPGNVGRALA